MTGDTGRCRQEPSSTARQYRTHSGFCSVTAGRGHTARPSRCMIIIAPSEARIGGRSVACFITLCWPRASPYAARSWYTPAFILPDHAGETQPLALCKSASLRLRPRHLMPTHSTLSAAILLRSPRARQSSAMDGPPLIGLHPNNIPTTATQKFCLDWMDFHMVQEEDPPLQELEAAIDYAVSLIPRLEDTPRSVSVGRTGLLD